MKTSAKVTLLVLVSLGVSGGMVHLFAPTLFPSLLDKLTNPAPAAKPAPKTEAPAAPERPDAEAELRLAEKTLDSGAFSAAIDLFLTARADATGATKERAERGLRRATLAWALTQRVTAPTPLPDDPDGEIARRQAACEANPNEKVWYELTQYAAGCGSARKLAYLAQQAVSCAIPGGPVEAHLRQSLAAAGPRTNLLRDAMIAEHLLVVADPVADTSKPVAKPRGPVRTVITPPAGNFKPETKAKLAQAVELEKKGTLEYDQSGPDNVNRKDHRKAALDYLKQARDIYEAAQEEDSDNPSLDRRMHDVMEMISHLRKEMNLGD